MKMGTEIAFKYEKRQNPGKSVYESNKGVYESNSLSF